MENIKIQDKQKCCGCGACRDVCPTGSITMEYNDEGFRYPVIDNNKCIHCNQCKNVCPIDKKPERDHKESFYAGYTNDSSVMAASSSGGIFWPIACQFLNGGGIVYGAVLKDGINIRHERCESIEDCKKIRKSKYLQSDLTSIYQQVKQDLKAEKKVLFSGTPCQVAALYSFLGRSFDNLYTIDVICHGVPSRAVFNRYIEEQEQLHHKKIVSYCWRDKSKGWGPNQVTVVFDDGSSSTTTSQENPMQKGFLDNWYLRPSCYQCQFAKIPRVADISLADFWGYDLQLKEKNNNRGMSLIVVSSNHGQELFESIKDQVEYHEVSKEYACAKSRHLWIHPKENNNRDKFMSDFKRGKTFKYLTRKYIMPSFAEKCKRKALRVIKRAIGK